MKWMSKKQKSTDKKKNNDDEKIENLKYIHWIKTDIDEKSRKAFMHKMGTIDI